MSGRELRISQSAIKDFIACNKRYYYRVNFPEEAVQTLEMAVGSAVHALLEHEWQDLDRALQQVPVYMNKFGLKEHYKTPIRKMVTNFFDSTYHDLLREEDLKEYTFKVPYSKGVYITGKYDRILKSNNLILDWKTGKPKQAYYNFANDIQSIIYYESYKQEFGTYPHIVYIYIKEDSDDIVHYIPDSFYTNIVYDEIIPDLISTIKSGNYSHQGLFNYSCNNCSFRNICWKELGRDLSDEQS